MRFPGRPIRLGRRWTVDGGQGQIHLKFAVNDSEQNWNIWAGGAICG